MKKVMVNAKALRNVLAALDGPPHYIRELQVIRNLPGNNNSIDILINEFNEASELQDENGLTPDELNLLRYEYLRNTDIDAIEKGGLFAGKTPENLTLNGEDLDIEIDKLLTQILSKTRGMRK